MLRKNLVPVLCASILAGAGCSAVQQPRSAPEALPPKQATGRISTPIIPSGAQAARSPALKPRTSQPAPPQTARPGLAGLVNGSFAWIEPDRSFAVTKNNQGPDAPVPLFRQAIVLADVRAALASSAARPNAEFRNGTLSLTFNRASEAEIADAVNRALGAGGVRRISATIAE